MLEGGENFSTGGTQLLCMARAILKRLREAARPETRLVVVEMLLPYACMDPTAHVGIPGAEQPHVPAPLLANLGRVSLQPYLTDITVCPWMRDMGGV